MKILYLIWLVLDSIVTCIFDTLLWILGISIICVLVVVATTAIIPFYHGSILVKKMKEIK